MVNAMQLSKIYILKVCNCRQGWDSNLIFFLENSTLKVVIYHFKVALKVDFSKKKIDFEEQQQLQALKLGVLVKNIFFKAALASGNVT
jgi:hypothetical protein